MKAFDLDLYNQLVREGKTPKIVTRDGRNARIFCTDRVGIHPIIALYSIDDGSGVTEDVDLFYADGRCHEDSNSPDDLFFADLEPTYRPYKDADECFKDVVKHGGWVKEKDTEFYYHVIRIDADGFCYTGDACESFQDMLNEHVWADDGQPCGRKEDCDA